MVKPSRADYQQAFQNPHLNFQLPSLQAAAPETDRLGLPKLMSGNFAVVCHMTSQRDTWAIRAFHKDVAGIRQRYELISSYLSGLDGQQASLVRFRYVPEGIRVNGEYQPIVVMDWVPGVQLDIAVDRLLNARRPLQPLIDSWIRLIDELSRHRIAHGDLQHGNILADGTNIRLVDYDGMFVPPMLGMSPTEFGHANYQHPQRSSHGFDSNCDRFSSLLILTALKALEHDATLWKRYGMPDNSLLFGHEDLETPDDSPLFHELLECPNDEVSHLASIVVESLASGQLPPSLSELLERPTATVVSSTRTSGWWRTGAGEELQGSQTPVPGEQQAGGSGWVRAFVGVKPKSNDGQVGGTGSSLDQVPYVASFGRKYVHLSTCEWARQIANRNLVGFPTYDEAIASGYKPCRTCKPQQLRQVFPTDSGTGDQSRPSEEFRDTPGRLKWNALSVRDYIGATRRIDHSRQHQSAQQRMEVKLGSNVKLLYSKGQAVLVRLVGTDHSSPTPSHVPADSPLGRAILGKKVGEKVTYREMGKSFKCTIIEVIPP